MPARKFTWDDLPALMDFIQAGKPANNQELRQQTFGEMLMQPELNPEHNCMIVESGGKPWGYAIIFPELAISRAVLQVELASRHLLGPVEQELIRWGIGRARELGLRVVHECLPQDSPRSKLLEENGFCLRRSYWKMLWQGDVLPSAEPPEGCQVRPFQAGDAPLLTRVQNETFSGSWGFCPNTVEQIEYRATMHNTSPQGIRFLYHHDHVAGYCWTVLEPVDDQVRGVISMIGVLPAYRGQGVSKPVLLDGMNHLSQLGVSDIGLEVDGNNTPAIRLYQSVGFKKVGELHWYELRLS